MTVWTKTSNHWYECDYENIHIQIRWWTGKNHLASIKLDNDDWVRLSFGPYRLWEVKDRAIMAARAKMRMVK